MLLRFSEEVDLRSRRFSHLAVLRFLLSLTYLIVEVTPQPDSGISVAAAVLFAAYSGLILLYRSRPEVRGRALAVQFADLGATAALALLSTSSDATLPLLLFSFLISESALLHGAREVIAVTAVTLVFYLAWIQSGEAQRFEFSYLSFLFLLLAGAALAYFYRDQKNVEQRRIVSLVRRSLGGSEAEAVPALEAALTGLARWLGASRAVLALWDKALEWDGVCFGPPGAGPEQEPSRALESGREWACLRGERLDFCANDVAVANHARKPIARSFDLHSYVIQKLEIYNACGAGLAGGEEPVGRLLVINNPAGFRRVHSVRLLRVAPEFQKAVLHLRAVKKTEQAAYERERARIAQDLHDGPLQSIISFGMRLRIIGRLVERDPRAAGEEIETLQQLSNALISETRTLVHGMWPAECGEASLAVSARRLIEGFQKESGVSVTFAGGENGDLALPGTMGAEVLQIIREALYNIYKHAEATHVLFSIERANGQLRIAIDDNGKGFNLAGAYSLEELNVLRLGPRSIKQRVRELGGELCLESRPGQGSNLRVTLPLHPV